MTEKSFSCNKLTSVEILIPLLVVLKRINRGLSLTDLFTKTCALR